MRRLKSHDAQYFYLLTIIGIFMMTFCSYTSPAFYFDYSPDNNAFFSVGKAMMHGVVPYKDIFEQKGPYVYFIHGLASLIAARSFIIIFVLEIIILVAAMWLTYRLGRLLAMRSLPALLIAIVSPVLFIFHPYYDYGDTVEYAVLPLILSLIYLVVLLDRHGFTVNHWWYFAQGLFVGIVFLSKYTLLGAWIAFYLMLGVYLLHRHRTATLWQMVLWSGAGFLLATVPWLLYFLATGSLKAFINVYFLFNTRAYLTSSVSVFANLVQSAVLLAQFFLNHVVFFVLGLLGTLLVIFQPKLFHTTFGRALYLVIFLASDLLALYGYDSGSVYAYYQLVYFAFFVLPLILMARWGLTFAKLPATDDPFIIVATVVLSTFLVLGVNNNVVSSRLFPNNASVTKQDTVVPQQPAQVVFGRIMRRSSQPLTLLNYGSIDMGFYTASGAVPNTYYFQNYNIPEQDAPQILRGQRATIRHRKVEWVVLNTPAKKTLRNWTGDPYHKGQITGGNLNPGTRVIAKSLTKNYRLVARHTQSFESVNVTYRLYQRRAR